MAKPAASVSVAVKSNKLPAIGSAARVKVGAAVRKAAFGGQTLAQVRARVDTGFYRSAIAAKQGTSDFDWLVHAAAGYSLDLERGTRYMAAIPNVEPAVREQLPQLERDVAEAMQP